VTVITRAVFWRKGISLSDCHLNMSTDKVNSIPLSHSTDTAQTINEAHQVLLTETLRYIHLHILFSSIKQTVKRMMYIN